MALKEAHALIPRPEEYVTFYGKREFAGVIRLRILRWGDYPGKPIQKVLLRGGRRLWVGEHDDVMTGAEKRMQRAE